VIRGIVLARFRSIHSIHSHVRISHAASRESVSIERRPVTGTSEVNGDAFTEKTVEVTETNEEAVVAKTARIAEEVVIHKEVEQHVETVPPDRVAAGPADDVRFHNLVFQQAQRPSRVPLGWF
jgi:Domain of unknown function (DUF2382)